MNFGVTESQKFWSEKINENDTTERKKPSLDLILQKGPEVICVPRYERRVKLSLRGDGNSLEVLENFFVHASSSEFE